MDSCLAISTNTCRVYCLDKRNSMRDGSFRISQTPSRGGCPVNFFEMSIVLPDNQAVIYDPCYFDTYVSGGSLYEVYQTGICVDDSWVELTEAQQSLVALYLSNEHILGPNLRFRCHEFAASIARADILRDQVFEKDLQYRNLINACVMKNAFHYDNLIVQDDWNKVDQYFWIKLLGASPYNRQMHSLLNMGNGVWLSKNMTTGLFATTLDQWLEIYPATHFGYMIV